MPRNTKFYREYYTDIRPATIGIPIKGVNRVETAIDTRTGQQVFVLDRREVLSTEDGVALSTGKDRVPPISNIRR